jgi:hypothetical protein
VNLNLSWSSVTSFLRQAAAIAGLVVAVGNTDHMPTDVRSVVVAVSGAILTAEHYAQAQSTTPVQIATTPVADPKATEKSVL